MMRPETSGPWRKTLRAEAKGEKRRRAHAPQPDVIRRGSTWLRRHQWMPDEQRRLIYAERIALRH